MKRRTFIQNLSVSGLACTFPTVFSAFNTPAFSTLELIGKADIALFGEGIQLRKAAYEAFTAMQKAAYANGFAIKGVSGYRNFYRQKGIWERKYRHYTQVEGLQPLAAITKIITYSTLPGTSRHHWGTDIDLIDGNAKASGDVLLPEKFGAGGPFEGLKLWLNENSEKFGFYVAYTNDPYRKGFMHEPWHYSYAPLAVPMLTAYRKLNIFQLLQEVDLPGCEYFTPRFIKMYLQDYILGIHPKLL